MERESARDDGPFGGGVAIVVVAAGSSTRFGTDKLAVHLGGRSVLERAVTHGVIYVVGEAFFVNGSGRNIVRLSFSNPTSERIREGVARLGAAVREALEATEELGV